MMFILIGKRKGKIRNRDPKKDSQIFYFTKKGVKDLLSLSPEIIAMEPTGVHYSTFLDRVCECEGIPVYWVGHQQVSGFRKQARLSGKTDLADALTLACYGHQYHKNPSAFLRVNLSTIYRVKELYFQHKTLSRVQNPLLNRGFQQLAKEFPEASKVKSNPSPGDGRRPLWCWLAGRDRPKVKKYSYWANRYEQSVGKQYEIEISRFTRKIAGQIDDLDCWKLELEKELSSLVYSLCFTHKSQN